MMHPAAVKARKTPASHADIVMSNFRQKLYGNRDCQASKGFDKHVSDGDAGFVDM